MPTPEPHQLSAASFLASRFHAALGDERGLGKTVSAILAADLVGAQFVLVVCPASVRTSWEEHLREWGSRRLYTGRDIVSYNYAGPIRDRYDLIILDEVHFCKNLDSQRTKAVFGREGWARRARFKWCLSGTVAPNGRPVELFPMLKTLAPQFARLSFAEYTRLYCGAYYDGRGWNAKGASRIDELSALLKDFMLRRTVEDVYPGRARPLVSRVPLELTAEDLNAVRDEEGAIGAREQHLSPRADEFSQMGDTSKLLRLLGLAKVRAAIAFVDDLLEGGVEKVAVFYHHVDVGHGLAYALATRGIVRYRGGMTDEQKADALIQFANSRSRVFLGQQVASGTGINGLQAVCSTAVIVEPSWTPGETDQVIGRLDRMGQKDELVRAYLLYARGTLDAVKVRVHDRKEKTGERLMNEDRNIGRLLSWL